MSRLHRSASAAGRHVVITGAGSGIGRSVAAQLGAAGVAALRAAGVRDGDGRREPRRHPARPDPAVSEPNRIRPGHFGEIGPIAWVLAHAGGRLAGTEPMNLFLVLGRHRKLFRGWVHFAGRLMPGGALRRSESELVILRVAHRRGSAYEYGQHVRIGKRAGLTDVDLERVRTGPEAARWTPRQRAMPAVVDELLDRRDVGDEAWAELREHFDEREAIELVLLAGHYDMLATAIAALRIPVEAPHGR